MAPDPHPLRTLVLVSCGVALGALARWMITRADVGVWAALVANTVGCAVAGLAARHRPALRAFWLTGVAGGLSTLSAIGIDTRMLWTDGRGTTAVVYVVATCAAGLGAIAIARTATERVTS